MNEKVKRMYPIGADWEPKEITYAGTGGTLDASKYKQEVVSINLSNAASGAVTYAISNPVVGTIYVIEQSGAGTAGVTVTLTGCTINNTGHNTVVFNAAAEAISLVCISKTKYAVLGNVGVPATSEV